MAKQPHKSNTQKKSIPKVQTDLFGDSSAPEEVDTTVIRSDLVTSLHQGSAALTKEQARFNRLLKQSETLAAKLVATEQMAQTHRVAYSQTVNPLLTQHLALQRDMVLWLDQRLAGPKLTAKLQRIAKEILCGLAGAMAARGDAEMHALHDKHSKTSLADGEREAAAEMQAMMEGLFGKSVGDGQSFDSMDELLRAAHAEMQAKAEAQEARRAARNAKKASTSKATAAQQAQQAAQEDAQGTLRSIYRQLASALHPDREPDATERDRKTALMKDVNAAYEKRDLLALLQLQMQAELAGGDRLANLAKEKMDAMTLLLKERVAVLTRDIYQAERHMAMEFEMPQFATVTDASLRRNMVIRKQELDADIAMMRRDLQAINDDRAFKRWLTEQHQMSQEDDDFPFPLPF